MLYAIEKSGLIKDLTFDNDLKVPSHQDGYKYSQLIALQILGPEAPVEMPVVEVEK